jgi:hypothetical protein
MSECGVRRSRCPFGKATDGLSQRSRDGNLVRTGETELLVTEESARHNYCQHVAFSTDHRGLVRFDTDSDANYQRVKNVIEALAPSAVCKRFSAEEGL